MGSKRPKNWHTVVTTVATVLVFYAAMALADVDVPGSTTVKTAFMALLLSLAMTVQKAWTTYLGSVSVLFLSCVVLRLVTRDRSRLPTSSDAFWVFETWDLCHSLTICSFVAFISAAGKTIARHEAFDGMRVWKIPEAAVEIVASNAGGKVELVRFVIFSATIMILFCVLTITAYLLEYVFTAEPIRPLLRGGEIVYADPKGKIHPVRPRHSNYIKVAKLLVMFTLIIGTLSALSFVDAWRP